MGGCCVSSDQSSLDDVVYENLKVISIKEKDEKGNTLNHDNVTISLTYPSFQAYEKVDIDSETTLEVSCCILPGLDPRGTVKKECQDATFYAHRENIALFGLFDGHGREGTKVAKFCCEYMKTFFDENFDLFKQDKQKALRDAIVKCDNFLRKKSGIDARLSGTTAICIIIDSESFYVSSVGDSRAVLATIPDSNDIIEDIPPAKNIYTRRLEPIRTLKPIALSVDQKPNHELELKRINEYGGRVMQLSDEFGNKVGPFRVWKKDGTLPGLAMSRSVGDGIAKKLGVVAEPIFHHFPHFKFRDQFLVICSDGVWDVIENIEVVNFVEKFRKRCLSGISPRPYPHNYSNSSIAHLLAEEARYRWFGICVEEDVIIDDISVIVIQLVMRSPVPMALPAAGVRRTAEMNSVVEVSHQEVMKPAQARGDAVRGSFVPAKEEKNTEKEEKPKTRFDPKRGSYINRDEGDQSNESSGDEEDTNLDI
jgi:serine/threonine protein phosphatase PrpC